MFPVLYYFINLKLGTKYLKAVKNVGYTPDKMRVIPVITPADIYSMREDGDDNVWLEDYVHGDQPEEEVRIVQAGIDGVDYWAKDVYSICILETCVAFKPDVLNQFDEIWVPKIDMAAWYEVAGVVGEKLEVMPVGDVNRCFDPMSLA